VLRPRAVLLRDRVQPIRPVHHAQSVGPAIELALARRRRGTRRGRTCRWCGRRLGWRRWCGRRRRGIRDPHPPVGYGHPVAAKLVPPMGILDDVLRRRGWRRAVIGRRRIVVSRRGVVHRRCGVRRGVIRGWRRVDDGGSGGDHGEGEKRPNEGADEWSRDKRTMMMCERTMMMCERLLRPGRASAARGAACHRAPVRPLGEGGGRREQASHREGQSGGDNQRALLHPIPSSPVSAVCAPPAGTVKPRSSRDDRANP